MNHFSKQLLHCGTIKIIYYGLVYVNDLKMLGLRTRSLFEVFIYKPGTIKSTRHFSYSGGQLDSDIIKKLQQIKNKCKICRKNYKPNFFFDKFYTSFEWIDDIFLWCIFSIQISFVERLILKFDLEYFFF